MEKQTLKVQSIQKVTHDVSRISTEKPENFDFEPSLVNEMSLLNRARKGEKGPFTFSSLQSERSLEFTIKTYRDHQDMTNDLLESEQNDEKLPHDVFDTFPYKGEGVFIAGGPEIIPIFRDLKSKNKVGKNQLIFTNKTKSDTIRSEEFEAIFWYALVNIFSEKNAIEHHYGVITNAFWETCITDFKQLFYLCGPPPMIKAMEKQLLELGVDKKLITKNNIKPMSYEYCN